MFFGKLFCDCEIVHMYVEYNVAVFISRVGFGKIFVLAHIISFIGEMVVNALLFTIQNIIGNDINITLSAEKLLLQL